MAGIALTGSASGIGAATRRRLERRRRTMSSASTCATPRWSPTSGPPPDVTPAVAAVLERSLGVLDGYAGFAGVPATVDPPAELVHVSYFGSIAMLEGLRGALVRDGAAAARWPSRRPPRRWRPSTGRSSTRASTVTKPTRRRCPYRAASRTRASSSRWRPGCVGRRPTWAAEGIRLNALAPGNTHTPLSEVTLADPEIGPLMQAVPVPVGRWADPDEIAAAAEWMLGADSSFLVGTVLFVDGGTDAMVRPDTF